MPNIRIEDNEEMFCFVDDPGLFEFKELMRERNDPDDYGAGPVPKDWNVSPKQPQPLADEPTIKDFEDMDINDHGYGSADMLDSLSDNDDFLMGHERGLKMPSWSS